MEGSAALSPETLKFTIIIPPKGQMRMRDRVVEPKGGKGKPWVQHYKDPDQQLEERRLINLLLAHRPPVPLQGPLLLGLKAFLPIPASKSKKWKTAALAGNIRPTTKPDLDNLAKNLKDVFKGIFWVDDAQVVGYLPQFGKYYGEPARWEIEIRPFVPGENLFLQTYPDVCLNCSGPFNAPEYSAASLW